jgi:chemotaxis protein CheZ
MVPILKVREIISMPVITALPHLPGYVKGISNLRGSIIPIVNLSTLLDSSGSEDTGSTVIVIATGQIIFGIIVDGITGVVKVDEDKIEPPEKFINNDVERIDGVAKLDDKLIVLLNTSKLLPLDDMTLLEEAIVEVSDSTESEKVEVVREIDTIGGKVTVKELRDAKDFMGDKLDDSDPKNNIFNMMLEFMDALSSQEYDKVEGILENLLKATDSSLFNEVGKITRKLHDSIEDFKGAIDSGLEKFTKSDVPNAVDKLQFVMTKTEDAANKTMGIVERYFEESDEFSTHVEKLEGPDDSVHYFETFKNALDNDMTDILTAQQFQDITGQTIKKVIKLVHSVEAELLTLITQFGMQVNPNTAAAVEKDTSDDGMPELEGKSVEKVSQSDVEALLGEFGF